MLYNKCEFEAFIKKATIGDMNFILLDRHDIMCYIFDIDYFLGSVKQKWKNQDKPNTCFYGTYNGDFYFEFSNDTLEDVRKTIDEEINDM